MLLRRIRRRRRRGAIVADRNRDEHRTDDQEHHGYVDEDMLNLAVQRGLDHDGDECRACGHDGKRFGTS